MTTLFKDLRVFACAVVIAVGGTSAESLFNAQQSHKVCYSIAELQLSVPVGPRSSPIPSDYAARTDPYRLVQGDCAVSEWADVECAHYARGHASGRHADCASEFSAEGVLARNGCAECGECGNYYLVDAVTAGPGEVPCVDAPYVNPFLQMR